MRTPASYFALSLVAVALVAAVAGFTFSQIARGDQNFGRYVQCEEARLRE